MIFQIKNCTSDLNFGNSRGGIEIVSIKSNKENVLQKGSKLFEFQIENLSNQSQSMIDSLHGWGSIVLNKTSSQIKTTFSNPQNRNLPTTLKVISTINLEGTKSKWDIEVNGVGNENSIVDIFAPKLRFNILHNGKFLIPKYTGKIIDVESEKIDRNMLYPAGWQSTMQFLAYYNNRVGIYLGNHDPKASTKRFRVLKKDGAVEYSTNIIPPNKTLANNNFKLSGVFELDSFNGDWYDAAQIYKAWASKNALYWPKMTPSRIKRQHKIGEVALWTSCIYIGAIEDSNRTIASKDQHIANYLSNIENILVDYASNFPNIGLGIFWHEWYGQLHDTNFPSVFFPSQDRSFEIKQMMANVKQQHPQVQFMPYINGLLYNVNLPNYVRDFALKTADGNIVPYFPAEGDQNRPKRYYARMDPTQSAWQDTIKDAASVVLNDIDADSLHVDQVTASNAIEDMDTNHNHPLAGGHWWRDGYDKMFTKIDSVAKGSQYITSEGANEFISNHVDGFFLHWDGVNKMVPAYQSVYNGKVQLFGLQMRSGDYNKNSFYMQYAQAFTNALQLGIVTTYITKDPKVGASQAFHFVKNLATMRYKLREFFSYGQMLKNVNLRGDIPNISDFIKDHGASSEPDQIANGTIPITMSAIQHAVYKNEKKNKVAFIFTNASTNQSVDFSFDIDPAKYGLGNNLSISEVTYEGTQQSGNIRGVTTKNISLHPLESIAIIIN